MGKRLKKRECPLWVKKYLFKVFFLHFFLSLFFQYKGISSDLNPSLLKEENLSQKEKAAQMIYEDYHRFLKEKERRKAVQSQVALKHKKTRKEEKKRKEGERQYFVRNKKKKNKALNSSKSQRAKLEKEHASKMSLEQESHKMRKKNYAKKREDIRLLKSKWKVP